MLDHDLFGSVAVALVVIAVVATLVIHGGWMTWIAVLAYFATGVLMLGAFRR